MHIRRTYRAKIHNHSQVERMLDRHGWSASKLWNVANYHSHQVWDDTGEIPDDSDLKRELKSHTTYKGLHSQSSQRVERGLYVCEDCAAAFNADVNGAENIRLNINEAESNSKSSTDLVGDRSTGWLAQPAVYLHDLSHGFSPREQVVDCKL